MKNKKAQIGKGIVFLPVLLFIIMVLAVYLFVAVGTLIKKPSEINPESISLTDNDLLLKKINIPINGKEREMLVLDAYILFDNEKIEYKTLRDSLKKIINVNNNCLILAKGYDTSPAGKKGDNQEMDDFYFYFKINNQGEFVEYSAGDLVVFVRTYSSRNLMKSFSFIDKKGEKKNIEYYYGECKR